MVQKPQTDAERKERRIDLSLPQVAGSAVAAVAAAVMASQLGVYGTIAGAGVMSVVATCGGSVFQHFFRRTGQQIREVTVQVKHPAGRQITVHTRETSPAERHREGDGTRVLRTVGTGADRTAVLRQLRTGGTKPRGTRRGTPDLGETRPGDAFTDDSYSDARTHGTRVRGWKRPALAATGVFVLSMGGVTVYEMVSGHGLGSEGRTTIGSVVRGELHGGATSPSPSDGTGQEDGSRKDGGGRDGEGAAPGDGSTATPGTDTGGGGGARPDPSGADGSAQDPAPTPSASGGTPTPGATTPATPGDDATAPAAPDPTGAEGVPEQQGGTGTDTDG